MSVKLEFASPCLRGVKVSGFCVLAVGAGAVLALTGGLAGTSGHVL